MLPQQTLRGLTLLAAALAANVLAAEPLLKSPVDEQMIRIKDVPHVAQKPDFCGEACAAMYLQKLGWHVSQDYVFNQSGLDPLEARGCYTRELAVALTKIGFRTGQVWYRIPVQGARAAIDAQWQALLADLKAGVPSIVCMHYDGSPTTTEHFRLILGYDPANDAVIYHEPAAAHGAYRQMPRATLEKLWPLPGGQRASTVIRLRLEPGRMAPQPAAPESFTAADFAQHLMKLKRKIPKGFTVVIEPPFVVLGDDPPEEVERRARDTVRWAVVKLKAAYFRKDPREILDIWLFKDDDSYRSHGKSIFHETPDTPYGFFSASEGALIMNISTGGGTLVHEIVHPFVAANFPHCPAWFNEGLGSLYEKSGEVAGQIHGFTNWRLVGKYGLQEAIRHHRVPSFKTLCSTSDEEFYGADEGTNYSQARYLCYYLQEHELLGKFYRRFHADRVKDPTGYATLQAVLGRRDMDVFKKEWEAWVLKLRFPAR
jgi:hypothetical protein